jgi:hypothetical protein
MLRTYEAGVCAHTFKYDLEENVIDRIAARIYDLRTLGWQIETERCDLHTHRSPRSGKRKYVVKYRLESYILKRGE